MVNFFLNNKHFKLKNISFFFGIVVLSLTIYLPSLKNGFLNWDDNWYITDNPYISDFSFSGIINMFTHLYHIQYSPLVMVVLSFLKYTFGLNPIPFHLTSLIFHIINIWLIFRFIDLLTGKTDLALFVATFFAVHTLQVESVAWMSAIKVVISTSFFLLSLIYYVRFNTTERKRNYYLSLLFFILALLSKEQTLILPLVIVTIDYFHDRKLLSRKVILEKIPYVFLSALFLTIAMIATYTQGFNSKMPAVNILYQIEIVFYSMFNYLSKFILPVNLSSFYPYPAFINYYMLIIPLLLTFIILFALIKKLITRKELIFAIGFFFINIFLTLQILPVRKIFMADRYMYLPLIGILLIIGFILNRLIKLNPKYKLHIISIVSVFIVFFTILSFSRTKVWNSSLSLWDNVINTTGKSYFPLLKRGIAYREEKNYNAALTDFNEAIKLNANDYNAYENRGFVYLVQNKYDNARDDFRSSIELNPESSYSYCNLGFSFLHLGKYREAMENINKAIEIYPGYADAYKNRGEVYIGMKNYEKACADIEKALSLGLTEIEEDEAEELKERFCEE